MRILFNIALFMLSLTVASNAPVVFASDISMEESSTIMSNDGDDDGHGGGHGHCPGGPGCKPIKTKCARFTLTCYYRNGCTAVSTFEKQVTLAGGEYADDSNGQQGNTDPELEVQCPGSPLPIYNNGANRYTGLLQTRIQAKTGPFPGLILPRGALHTGANSSGHHVSSSVLELALGDTTNGTCYIWSGAPLI